MAWPQQYNGWQQATGLNSQLCRWLFSFSMNLIKESRILLPELSLDLQNYRFVPIVPCAFWSYVTSRLEVSTLWGSNLLVFTVQSHLYSLLSRWQCSSQRAAGGTLHNKTNLTNSLSYTILIDHHIFFSLNNSEQFDGDPGRIAPLFENDHNTHTPLYGNIR